MGVFVGIAEMTAAVAEAAADGTLDEPLGTPTTETPFVAVCVIFNLDRNLGKRE